MIDAYNHLTTKKTIESMRKEFRDFLGAEILKLSDVSVDEAKDRWIEVLEEYKIEKVLFLATTQEDKSFDEFVASSDRFEGISCLNYLDDESLEILKRDIEQKGYKGLTLYPVWDNFSVDDERLNSIYEYCNERELPVIIHFGVSALPGDIRYGNPIDLGRVVKKFPKIKWVIAHFGAGYFKESLMMAYSNDNIYFDSSGTNGWIKYSSDADDLRYVFEKSIGAIGVDRIIWGSDSHKIFVEGQEYNSERISDQKDIVMDLAGEEGVRKIFSENAKKVFGF